jgi:hypothetical protein
MFAPELPFRECRRSLAFVVGSSHRSQLRELLDVVPRYQTLSVPTLPAVSALHFEASHPKYSLWRSRQM